jgi:hypothetical protein
MDERTLELIHGDIDGELDADGQQELRARLEASAEAREEHRRLQALSHTLARLPAFEPPPGLRDAVIGAAHRGAQDRKMATVPFRRPQAVRHRRGLALIVALAATVAGVALLVGRGHDLQELDPGVLAGTIGRPASQSSMPPLRIAETGVNGTVMLHRGNGGLALEVNLDVARPVAIFAAAQGAPLEVRGFVRIDGAPAGTEIVDGAIRITHSGRQHYALVLGEAPGISAIELGVYDGRQLIRETTLRVPPAGEN